MPTAMPQPHPDRREPDRGSAFPLYRPPEEAPHPARRGTRATPSGQAIAVSELALGADLHNAAPPGGVTSRALDPVRCGMVVLGVLAVLMPILLPTQGLPWYLGARFYFTLFGVAIGLRLFGGFTQSVARVSVTDELIVREGLGGWTIARSDVVRTGIEEHLGRPYLLVEPRHPAVALRMGALAVGCGWPPYTHAVPLDPACVDAIRTRLAGSHQR